MGKKTEQELESAKRRNAELQAHNVRLAGELSTARTLLEQGAEMLVSVGTDLEATKLELERARAELDAVRAECTAAVETATAAASAAEEREQLHKVRLSVATKIGSRLWKALESKHLKDALEFRDIHVRKGEAGLELLKD